MELRLLRYFLMVAQTENITKAADSLHITQPTLSRQMSMLEEETGVKLFERSLGVRKIILTEEGVLLKRRAQEILELVDKTSHELVDAGNEIQGTISIGCGEIATAKLLPDLIESFRAKHPLVRFDIYTTDGKSIQDRIGQGLLDFGILLEKPDSIAYDFMQTGVKETWVALMAPDHPLSDKEFVNAADLTGIPLILPQNTDHSSPLGRWLGPALSQINCSITCNLTSNAALLTRLGCAITIKDSVELAQDRFISRPLTPELCTKSVLIWKKGQVSSKTCMLFRDFARDYFEKRQEKLSGQ